MNSPFPSVHAMVQELGGSDEFWRADSEAYLLGLRRDKDTTRADPWPAEPKFPSHAYTSRFQENDLRAISDSVSAWRYAVGDTAARQVLQQWIAVQSGSYVASFKEEHPWDHLIGSRLRCTRRFIFHSGMDRELPDPVSFVSRSAKYLLTFFYVTMLLCGCVASFWALLRARQQPFLVVAALAFAYGLLVHPVIFRAIEGRYLAPFIPWCLLVSFVMIQRAVQRLLPQRR